MKTCAGPAAAVVGLSTPSGFVSALGESALLWDRVSMKEVIAMSAPPNYQAYIQATKRFRLERAPLQQSDGARAPQTSRSYATEMQRLFSMFPGGAAGIALMALRFCAGCLLSLCASTHVEFASLSWSLIGLGSILLLIGIGLLTPVACGVAAVIESIYLLHSHGTDTLHAAFAIAITVAVALLGPGAFSVDAELFGRRLIVPDQD